MRLFPKHKIRRLYLIVLALGILVIAWFLYSPGNPTPSPVTEKAWPVQTAILSQGSFQPTLVIHGVTESPKSSTLRAAITADVMATPILEGNEVKKGELMIQLDDRETKFRLDQTTAEVNEAKAAIATELNRFEADKRALVHERELVAIGKKNVMRQGSLAKRRVGSQAAFDEARRALAQQRLALTKRERDVQDHLNRLQQLRARLAKAQAAKSQSELDHSRTQIRAPFDGYVSQLLVSVGNRVRMGDPLINLYANDAIEIRAQIPSQSVATIQSALKIKKISLALQSWMDRRSPYS